MCRLSVLGLITGLIAGLLSVTSVWAGDTARPDIDKLKAHYEAIQQAVDAGELSKAKGRRADALWLDLRKDLITMNARIDSLKLDISASHGAKQQQAVQELVKAGTVRGRRLQEAMQKLDNLSGQKTHEADAVSSVPPPDKAERAKTANPNQEPLGQAQTKRKTDDDGDAETTTSSVELDFGPEDVINEPQHME